MKSKVILLVLIFVIGVSLGSMSVFLSMNHYKLENRVLFQVLEKNNPILPLKEYALIMKNSNGKLEEIAKGYAQIEKASYYINTYFVSSEEKIIKLLYFAFYA